MHFEVNFLSLALISLVAFLTPLIVSRVKFISIPEVIVQILAGFVLGKSGLDLIKASEPINFLSTLGFAFLMFLGGYEVDFGLFRRSDRKTSNTVNPFKNAVLITIFTLSLSLIFSIMLLYTGIVKNLLLATLIFSTTSLGIVVPVLKEKGIIDNPFGQTMLISALFSDFSTLFLLPMVMFFVKGKMDFSILYSGILFIFFIVVYFTLQRVKMINFKKHTLQVTQLEVRMVMSVLFLFAILADILGIEVIVGAFMAGALFSLVLKNGSDDIRKTGDNEACGVTEVLDEKLDAIGFGFLIPVFFIMIGVKFEVKSLFSTETLLILPIFLIIAYAVKVIPCLVILKKILGIKKSLSAGFLLSSRLSLIIALAAIALSNGIISNSRYSTFVIIAIITCLFSPVISIKLWGKSI